MKGEKRGRGAGEQEGTEDVTMLLRSSAPLLLCILAAFALRLPGLFANTFSADEALFATWARYIATWRDPLLLTQLVDKPPLAFYLQALFFPFFGPVEWAARLPNFIAGLLLIPLTVRLYRRLYRSLIHDSRFTIPNWQFTIANYGRCPLYRPFPLRHPVFPHGLPGPTAGNAAGGSPGGAKTVLVGAALQPGADGKVSSAAVFAAAAGFAWVARLALGTLAALAGWFFTAAGLAAGLGPGADGHTVVMGGANAQLRGSAVGLVVGVVAAVGTMAGAGAIYFWRNGRCPTLASTSS